MSTPDWHDTELDHEFHVYMIDPLDHSAVMGELEVYSDSGSVTWSDGDGVGVTASLEVPDWSKWKDGTWLRIVHRVPSYKYTRTLGTFIVWDDGASGGLEVLEGSPELCGAIRGLEYDYLPIHIAVGEGASMRTVISRVMDATPVPYRFAAGFKDYRFTEPHIFDAGVTRIDTLRDLCNIGGNEVFTGEEGSIVFRNYVYPGDVTPLTVIDCTAANTTVFESSVQRTSLSRQIAGRSIALWSGRDDEGAATIGGYADVSSRHIASPQRRGYIVSEVHELDDLSEPKTYEHAQALARQWLKEDSTNTVEWTFTSTWLPLVNGDVVTFRPPGMGFRKCVVETVNADLGAWTVDVTLKEV